MKKIKILLLSLIVITLTHCTNSEQSGSQQQSIDTLMTTEQQSAEQVKPFYQGTILETIDAGGYTYLRIKENLDGHHHVEGDEHKDFWIAVERTPAKVGDEVRFQKELVTEQFYSKILDRTFDELMFASNLQHRVKD
ncbi:MAG: hypothetical protein DSY76_08165 [Bacteroidetes bacterium]|nr:MAG: hypothetical protein DSY76_08165 [Bacteroidota bacterium]